MKKMKKENTEIQNSTFFRENMNISLYASLDFGIVEYLINKGEYYLAWRFCRRIFGPDKTMLKFAMMSAENSHGSFLRCWWTCFWWLAIAVGEVEQTIEETEMTSETEETEITSDIEESISIAGRSELDIFLHFFIHDYLYRLGFLHLAREVARCFGVTPLRGVTDLPTYLECWWIWSSEVLDLFASGFFEETIADHGGMVDAGGSHDRKSKKRRKRSKKKKQKKESDNKAEEAEESITEAINEHRGVTEVLERFGSGSVDEILADLGATVVANGLQESKSKKSGKRLKKKKQKKESDNKAEEDIPCAEEDNTEAIKEHSGVTEVLERFGSGSLEETLADLDATVVAGGLQESKSKKSGKRSKKKKELDDRAEEDIVFVEDGSTEAAAGEHGGPGVLIMILVTMAILALMVSYYC